MQMQPGRATLWAQGKRRPMRSAAARTIAVGDPTLESVPDIVDAPLRRMTRHAGDAGSFARSCRSWGVSPGRPQAVTSGRAECGSISPPALSTGVSPAVDVLRRHGVQNATFRWAFVQSR